LLLLRWIFVLCCLRFGSFELMFRETERCRDVEFCACVRIQSCVRGWITRRYIKDLNARAVELQRLWRGHTARKRCERIKMEVRELQAKVYFDHMATKIQKIWRGYASRKNLHDHYKRRAYINNVLQKSAKVMEHLNEIERRNQLEVQAKQQEAMTKKFTNLTSNMHHLLSTSAQAGVFNTPGNTVTAFGVPVEAHIRFNFSRTKKNEPSKLQKVMQSEHLKKTRNSQPNFHPFGSRSRRFGYSPKPARALGSSSKCGISAMSSGKVFTWSSAPSPVCAKPKKKRNNHKTQTHGRSNRR